MSHPNVIDTGIAVYRGLKAMRERLADQLITYVVEEPHLRRGLSALDEIDRGIEATENFLDHLAPGWDDEDDESAGGGNL